MPTRRAGRPAPSRVAQLSRCFVAKTIPSSSWLVTALLAALSLPGCGSPDTFRPIYYPAASNLLEYTRGPSFDNLAQARQWVEDQGRQRGDPNSTYEIGKNCRPFGDSDVEVCEETLQ